MSKACIHLSTVVFMTAIVSRLGARFIGAKRSEEERTHEIEQ